jgi:hypothetical protein
MELRAVVIRPPATLKVLEGLVRSERGRDPPGRETKGTQAAYIPGQSQPQLPPHPSELE